MEYFPVLHTSQSVEYNFFLRFVEYGFCEVWCTGFSKCGERVFDTEKCSAVCLLLELMDIYGNVGIP